MFRISIPVLIAILLTGCAVTKVPMATGGSKSDGTIKMSYEQGGFEQVTVDESTARQNALERCKAWGYEDVDAFGGRMSKCVATNAYGCIRERITITYQCLGEK